ncbi:mannitol dehydrogenase family protein [Salipiger sp. 1_MG-2023]|uniref:mannitol dehydrogenase family protein n=1 Tax=Salipiger sp. 1_MG-2023 TaxID=3062665 RepID=UPI0026E11EDF|nr:mannitol dehydrogenase family protein [Salipiger sp. 1_MG-2023]MDO6585102.1 mannitol dehydrogenase family protein [Salipiger sp. 1_MG-2023]
MSAARLGAKAALGPLVQAPAYDPEQRGEGIVHLGFGAFHRAHQAVYTDDALAAEPADWRIVGVSLRSADIAREINAQDGRYTVIERDASGSRARVIGAVSRVIAADPAATLAALCAPQIRIVTITVTEKGYGIDLASHAPDRADPAVAADLETPEAPRGVLGLLVEASRLRREAGHLPLTILSCDNLPANGVVLRDGVIGFAGAARGDALAEWIAQTIAFPCSMVDRITPAPSADTASEALRLTGCEDRAAIETEPFVQWVIEDSFPTGRPQWDAGGALFVKDVAGYERMKLTMLNGSHSMLAYAGHLTGCTYVRDVMQTPALAALVRRHMAAAAALLDPLPGAPFDAYAEALAQRFANPSIAHQTFQIATDGTQKLPQRIFEPALLAIAQGRPLRPFAFAAAMWMRFCLGRQDDGTLYELRDPRAAQIKAALPEQPDATSLSAALHGLPGLIPETLGKNPDWRAAIEEILTVALEQGSLACVEQETASANTYSHV